MHHWWDNWWEVCYMYTDCERCECDKQSLNARLNPIWDGKSVVAGRVRQKSLNARKLLLKNTWSGLKVVALDKSRLIHVVACTRLTVLPIEFWHVPDWRVEYMNAFGIDSASFSIPSGWPKDHEALQNASRCCRANSDRFPNIPKGCRVFAEDPEATPIEIFGVQTLKILKFRCRSFFDPEFVPTYQEVFRKC